MNKYCEGKVKRTLKRELKVPEIVKRKAYETGDCGSSFHLWLAMRYYVLLWVNTVSLEHRREFGRCVGVKLYIL